MSSIRRLIPNLFTAGNLVSGVLAIILTLDGHLYLAPYCILIAAFFDLLDGMMARLLKVDNEIGKQLDSLADMVTFGVAPGLIMYQIFRLSLKAEGIENLDWLVYTSFLLPVFALFRLAKFNVSNDQKEHFVGLPTPAMTIFFASFPLIIHQTFSGFTMGKLMMLGVLANPYSLVIWTVVMSILMVAPIRMFSLKFKKWNWSGNKIRYIFLTISLVLLATLFVWALPLIILLYIVLSILNNLFNKSVKDEIQSGN